MIKTIEDEVKITAASNHMIRIRWKSLKNARKYRIFIKKMDGGFRLVKSSKTNCAIIKGLKAGTKYKIKVIAVKNDGIRLKYNVATVKTVE